MNTIVYYDYESGDVSYEQFDSLEEVETWKDEHDFKAIIVIGKDHTIEDRT